MKMLILLMAAEVLFVATQFTAPQSFTAQIEGPACDRAGNVYAVSFERKATIGRVTPDGKGEVFVEMPSGSLGNGIRFDKAGMMTDAALVQPGEADATIRKLFASDAVDHIDAHNATRGCFAARVERA